MEPYSKYDKRGPVHWKWYVLKVPLYLSLVDDGLAHFKEEGTVIDVGCGDGLSSYLLAHRGFKVTGVDASAKGIELATELIRSKSFKGIHSTVEDYVESTDEEFDYLYSMNTIEHVDDAKTFVKLMERVKKFGIVITDNGATNKRHPFHTQEFTKESLRDLFSDFRVEPLKFNYPKAESHFIGVKVFK